MAYSWLDKLERRFGDWAIPQLASFIIGMNAIVWVLSMMRPEFPSRLTLEPHLILQGEIWRLVTFLFIPPALGPIWMFFWLYLLFTYAQALEHEWGDFRFNLFYGLGAALTILASLGLGIGLSNIPLHTTLFLAFAALYPDFELLLFFILPVKIKWLAALAWIGILWNFLTGSGATKLALLAGLANYMLFFVPKHWESAGLKLQTWRNRRRFRQAFKNKDEL